MLAILGILLVFAAVIGGFLMERGNPWVLMQPAELLIICGAGAGIVLVSNSPAGIRKMLRGVLRVFHPRVHTSQSFLEHLRMLYELFLYSQRAGGIMQLEQHVETPAQSAIFSRYPEFLRDGETLRVRLRFPAHARHRRHPAARAE